MQIRNPVASFSFLDSSIFFKNRDNVVKFGYLILSQLQYEYTTHTTIYKKIIYSFKINKLDYVQRGQMFLKFDFKVCFANMSGLYYSSNTFKSPVYQIVIAYNIVPCCPRKHYVKNQMKRINM